MAYKLSDPDQWLELYRDILYRYGFARVRDSCIAEEMVQETLLAALRSKDGFAARSSEKTWLIGILKHKILDYFRYTAKERSMSDDVQSSADIENDYFDQSEHWLIDSSSWFMTDHRVEQEQFLSVFEQCMSRLSPRMAQLFILSELDGIESRKICELMSISSLNNFWVMMSRTRMQLRHCLHINWLDQ